jgi:hypothetical protein
MQTNDRRIPLVLFLLRLSIFLVMIMWTIDKLVRPTRATSVFEHFYGLRRVGPPIIYGLAVAELLLLVAFVIGAWRRLTHGPKLGTLVLHGFSTFTSFRQYFAPFDKVNLLFFAAWPMLAACFALYYLRDLDTLCSVLGSRVREAPVAR